VSLTPEQIETRRTGITSTDASAIVGLSRKAALEVYASKVGEGTVVEDNEAMYWGRKLEPLVARRYVKAASQSLVLSDPGTRRHKTERWMLATPDRLVAPWGQWPTWGLECKTAFAIEQVKRWGDSEDRMPWEYIVQCQWCMGVMGFTRWDVAVLLGGYHGADYRQYTLHYDDGRIMTHPTKGVIARCRQFHFENVLKRIPPEPDGSASAQAAISAMYTRADLDVKLAMNGEEEDLLEDYRGALADKKLAEQAEAEARQKLEMLIGDAEGIEHPEIGTVTWKKDKRGKRRWNSRGVKV